MSVSFWFHVTCIPVFLAVAFGLGWLTGKYSPPTQVSATGDK